MIRHLTFRKGNDGVYGTGQSAVNTQADPCPRLKYIMYTDTPFHNYYIRIGYDEKWDGSICICMYVEMDGGGEGLVGGDSTGAAG